MSTLPVIVYTHENTHSWWAKTSNKARNLSNWRQGCCLTNEWRKDLIFPTVEPWMLCLLSGLNLARVTNHSYKLQLIVHQRCWLFPFHTAGHVCVDYGWTWDIPHLDKLKNWNPDKSINQVIVGIQEKLFRAAAVEKDKQQVISSMQHEGKEDTWGERREDRVSGATICTVEPAGISWSGIYQRRGIVMPNSRWVSYSCVLHSEGNCTLFFKPSSRKDPWCLFWRTQLSSHLVSLC